MGHQSQNAPGHKTSALTATQRIITLTEEAEPIVLLEMTANHRPVPSSCGWRKELIGAFSKGRVGESGRGQRMARDR